MPSEQKIIVIPDGKICDYIDGKFRNDTPEEYVRQTIEKRLVNEHKYLPEQIRIEYTLQVGSNKPRADIVIWEKGADQTQGTIKLIIECKKETVDARNAKDGISAVTDLLLSLSISARRVLIFSDISFCSSAYLRDILAKRSSESLPETLSS